MINHNTFSYYISAPVVRNTLRQRVLLGMFETTVIQSQVYTTVDSQHSKLVCVEITMWSVVVEGFMMLQLEKHFKANSLFIFTKGELLITVYQI